jgi:serine/threonine protein kinase
MSRARDRLTAALSDRYRLDRELGAGGMATVYLARDLKHDRDVAIKVHTPELAASLTGVFSARDRHHGAAEPSGDGDFNRGGSTIGRV